MNLIQRRHHYSELKKYRQPEMVTTERNEAKVGQTRQHNIIGPVINASPI
jgi:hypothetical protein